MCVSVVLPSPGFTMTNPASYLVSELKQSPAGLLAWLPEEALRSSCNSILDVQLVFCCFVRGFDFG